MLFFCLLSLIQEQMGSAILPVQIWVDWLGIWPSISRISIDSCIFCHFVILPLYYFLLKLTCQRCPKWGLIKNCQKIHLLCPKDNGVKQNSYYDIKESWESTAPYANFEFLFSHILTLTSVAAEL